MHQLRKLLGRKTSSSHSHSHSHSHILPAIVLMSVTVVLAGAVTYIFVSQQNPSPLPAPSDNTNSTPSTPRSKPSDLQKITVELGTTFTLAEGQTAIVGTTGLEITILSFMNQTCPKDALCFWSGKGVSLEYRHQGKTETGLNLSQAFGYRTIIGKTDYETYANLTVEKEI